MHAEPRLSQQQNIARSSDMVCIITLNVFKGMYILNKNIHGQLRHRLLFRSRLKIEPYVNGTFCVTSAISPTVYYVTLLLVK